MTSCAKCGGLIPEPNTSYGYSGKWCYCSLREQQAYSPPILEEIIKIQQVEIEELKKQLKASALLNYNKGHEDGRNLSTKKTVTHEDLVDCIDGHIPLGLIEEYGWERIYEFARAILRKAQEK